METHTPNRRGYLPWQRYRELIRADAGRLAEMAERGLETEVPSCSGWTMEHLVDHVGFVYEHKVACVRDAQRPDSWPPSEFDDLGPMELYSSARAHLEEQFDSHDPEDPSWTFYPDDETVGFWIRRMAQETAVHRHDAELAHDDVTPIDAELAVDGVDEILKVMIARPSEDTEAPVDARIRVRTGGRAWTVTANRHLATVDEDDTGPVDAEIAGDPEPVLLWLWGRGADDFVRTSGSADVLAAFGRRIGESTG